MITQMRIGEGKPGFFAIASPPEESRNNQGVVELLIKAVPDTASEQLAATKPCALPQFCLSQAVKALQVKLMPKEE